MWRNYPKWFFLSAFHANKQTHRLGHLFLKAQHLQKHLFRLKVCDGKSVTDGTYCQGLWWITALVLLQGHPDFQHKRLYVFKTGLILRRGNICAHQWEFQFVMYFNPFTVQSSASGTSPQSPNCRSSQWRYNDDKSCHTGSSIFLRLPYNIKVVTHAPTVPLWICRSTTRLPAC